ncbi:hypothetical protein EII17_07175 [Clostridiales bacterium COT073_COT-073]|nr:hypothetical protein EII17_07175 [Clostridiales bacterium COT073_COT-073]
MRKRLSIFMVLVLMVLSLGACTGQAPTEKNKGETGKEQAAAKSAPANETQTSNAKPKAVVTILPQAEWVKAVAGDLFEVTTLLPPGASPEVYQASPKEMVALEEADIYFTISVPVEVEGIIPNTMTKAKIVDLAKAAADEYPERFFEEDEFHEHDDHDHGEHKDEAKHDDHDHKDEGKHEDHKHDHDHQAKAKHDDHDDHHHHSGRDPHIWMSPKRVAVMVIAICDALVEMDAANAETYKKNAETYLNQLQQKDKKLTEVLSKVKTRDFIIMHPSMGYFADDYDLDQISIEKEGKQATAEHLKKVIDFAKDHEIKVIFYQKEFDNNQAKTIAGEIGGEVMELEPLAENYLQNLDKLAETFAATLN